MIKQYIPTQAEQNDLIKTTDACVDYVFDQGAKFIQRHHLPQEVAGSLPISVALTILNSLLDTTHKEHQESFKHMIMANIENMFLRAESQKSLLH